MLNKAHHPQSYYFFTDNKTRIVHTSEAFRQLSGHAYAALEGSLLDSLFSLANNQQPLSQQIHSKTNIQQQVHMLNAQQQNIDAMLLMHPVHDDQGKLCGYEGHLLPSFRHEESQQAEAQRPIIRLSQDGIVIYANTHSQPILTSLGGQLGSRLPAAWHHKISQAHQQRQVFTFDIGSQHHLHRCQCIPQHDEMLITTRIHEHHTKQAKKPASTAETQQHLHLRSAVHDLNNTLGIIMGNVSLMRKFPDDSSAMDTRIKRIFKATQTAASLCQNLLTPQQPSSQLKPPISTTILLNHVRSMLDGAVEQDAIALNFQNHAPDLSFHANPQQLQRVLLNLIINAKQSLSASGGKVDIITGQMDVGIPYIQQCSGFAKAKVGQYAYVDITDNGCGMDDATKQQLFEPSFSTKVDGHGLGMHSVLNIIQDHQGLIHVQSQLGQGSNIRILFPLVTQQQMEVHTLLNNIAKQQQQTALI